jgi:signal peptidase I
LLAFARKVLRYRRHLLDQSHIETIENSMASVIAHMADSDREALTTATRRLDICLREHGGDIFPLRFLNDNVEVIFVGALLAIALRTFFFQSFQIPTNSMSPTYCGMEYRIVSSERRESLWRKIWNGIKSCGEEVDVIASRSGEVSIPIAKVKSVWDGTTTYIVPYEADHRRKWFGLKNAKVRSYIIFIGGEAHRFTTPIEFAADRVLLERFCGGAKSWNGVIASDSVDVERRELMDFVHSGIFVKAGSSALRFEIIPGDMLFADKLSCHFRRPRLGESVVFHSDRIDAFANSPKFLIKRLVGRSGDVIKIENGQLLTNGMPLATNETIEQINGRSGRYGDGYVAIGMLADGREVTVPPGQCFVLGDNSADSYDSRFWGFVPESSICGRPLLIFYPFSERVGRCK